MTTTAFQDLSGVVFHGNRLAVTANVQPNGAPAEARLLVVDYDLDATYDGCGWGQEDPIAQRRGGRQGIWRSVPMVSVVYVTGNSLSPRASVMARRIGRSGTAAR